MSNQDSVLSLGLGKDDVIGTLSETRLKLNNTDTHALHLTQQPRVHVIVNEETSREALAVILA
jgi:hypothetical protein